MFALYFICFLVWLANKLQIEKKLTEIELLLKYARWNGFVFSIRHSIRYELNAMCERFSAFIESYRIHPWRETFSIDCTWSWLFNYENEKLLKRLAEILTPNKFKNYEIQFHFRKKNFAKSNNKLEFEFVFETENLKIFWFYPFWYKSKLEIFREIIKRWDFFVQCHFSNFTTLKIQHLFFHNIRIFRSMPCEEKNEHHTFLL